MVETRLTDSCEAAYIAGGTGQVVNAAVVAPVETGRVPVARRGDLCVVEEKPRHDIRAALCQTIGLGGQGIDIVQQRGGHDDRLTALVEGCSVSRCPRVTAPTQRLDPLAWEPSPTPLPAGRAGGRHAS